MFPDEIVYIINHAQDRVLFVDPSYVGFLIGHKHLLETVERFYITGPKQNEIAARMNGLEFLVDLLEEGDVIPVASADEDAAVLRYTSGTTGNPKGVLYFPINRASRQYCQPSRQLLPQRERYDTTHSSHVPRERLG